MPRRFPKCFEEIEFLPGFRFGIVLEGPLTLVGSLIAEIGDDRHHDDDPPVFIPPKVDVHVNVDNEPEFLLIQLAIPFTLTIGGVPVTFGIGTIVAINIDEILVIGPQ